MRRAWQDLSALFGSAGPAGRPDIPVLVSVFCAALAYPLATEAGYAGAVGGAFFFCVATLFLAYSLGAGALAFTVEAKGSCLPGSQRLKRAASVIALLSLLALAVIPAAALAANPMWEAWVPTALVLGSVLASVLIPPLPIGVVGLLLLFVLTGYWAARGQGDHDRDMQFLIALFSAALSLPAVAKWRRVTRQDSRPPSRAGPLLRPLWVMLVRLLVATCESGDSAAMGGFRGRSSPVMVIRTCLGGYFAPVPVRTLILAILVTLGVAAMVGLPWRGAPTWLWTTMLVACLAAALIRAAFLERISKLTRAGMAELALLPGLGDGAMQRRALCRAVLAPPLLWLAGILLWGSAGLLFKGEPLSSVGALATYVLIIWLTYTLLALGRLPTFPPRPGNRISGISTFLQLLFGIYFCTGYYYVYTLYSFTHVGYLAWVLWVMPVLAGLWFAGAIGYAVRRLAMAPHPFLS